MKVGTHTSRSNSKISFRNDIDIIYIGYSVVLLAKVSTDSEEPLL